MKKIFDGFSVLFATLLLLCCLAPFIPVYYAPFLSFLSLTAPLFFIANLTAVIYGTITRSRLAWLSLAALLVGYVALGAFYKFGNPGERAPDGTLSVMNYNIRGFDRYNFFRGDHVEEGIISLVERENPDIVCFQEFDYTKSKYFNQYPYRFVNHIFPKERHVVQAIFSKYPIVGKGSLDFPNSANNAIFAEVLYKEDTLRIYNIHLQSFRIVPSRRMLRHMASGALYNRMSATFVKQQEQAELIRQHKASTPYKTILCGDLNNTQYSRIYRMVKGNMNDSYEEKGRAYGTTYKLKFLPFRIDAIMADPSLEVVSHRNFDVRLSDHYPLMASFRLKGTGSNSP
jgi:endonuclease/exonuclease/phosphatase family metal-dependent hydrolase